MTKKIQGKGTADHFDAFRRLVMRYRISIIGAFVRPPVDPFFH